MKRKKVVCGDKLASAIQHYNDTYRGLREYWKEKDKRALVKKWNKVLGDHDESQRVKCRGQKRKEVGPSHQKDGKNAKLLDFSVMEDFDSHGKGVSDEEGMVATNIVQI